MLLVAGMALMLVFSIGGQSARTGFALGRRALSVADGQVTEDQLRGLVRGLVLPPTGVDPQALGLVAFAGDERGFRGDAVLDRAGLCGPAGPAGALSVAIEPHPDGDLVTCRAGAAAPAVVADFRPRRVRFADTRDGSAWSDTWTPPLAPPVGVKPERAAQLVFIRLASDDGRIDIVEQATSGPSWLYPDIVQQPGAAGAQ